MQVEKQIREKIGKEVQEKVGKVVYNDFFIPNFLTTINSSISNIDKDIFDSIIKSIEPNRRVIFYRRLC
jgi:hypothetical protein